MTILYYMAKEICGNRIKGTNQLALKYGDYPGSHYKALCKTRIIQFGRKIQKSWCQRSEIQEDVTGFAD